MNNNYNINNKKINKKKDEEDRKKKKINNKDKNKLLTEDGTLSSFGFKDNYK